MKKIDISTPTHPNTFTLVDDADFDWLNQWKWRIGRNWNLLNVVRTAVVNGRKTTIRMAKEILNPPKGKETDHRNQNTLDNQRHNLRAATHTQNIFNQGPRKGSLSKYKGVSQYPNGTWFAQIWVKGKLKKLGCFKIEEDAGRRYDQEAKIVHGKFAYLNFN